MSGVSFRLFNFSLSLLALNNCWSGGVGVEPPFAIGKIAVLPLNYHRLYYFAMCLSAIVTFSPLYIPAPISSIFENGITGTVRFPRAFGSRK